MKKTTLAFKLSFLLASFLSIGITAYSQGSGKDKQNSFPPFHIPNTEVRSINSEITNINYKLYISLPRVYHQEKSKYPVIYTLDADYSFAIAHNTIEHYVDRRDLPKLIVVSIAYFGANQDLTVYRKNRMRDYTPTKAAMGVCGVGQKIKKGLGGAEKFLSFISSELIPFIETNYRAKKQDRTIVGHSAGGLFGTYALFTKPSVFQRYILVSPSLWWDDKMIFKLENNYAAGNTSLNANVFYSIGRWENPKICPMVSQMRQFVDKLKSRNYAGLTINSYVFPAETHNSVFPAALSRGLRVVFNNM